MYGKSTRPKNVYRLVLQVFRYTIFRIFKINFNSSLAVLTLSSKSFILFIDKQIKVTLTDISEAEYNWITNLF